jgi:hypothetical protein
MMAITVILVFALRNTHPAQRTNQIFKSYGLTSKKSINGIRLSRPGGDRAVRPCAARRPRETSSPSLE